MKNRPAKSSTAADITSRKQAEDALRESEAKFRTIFESFEDLYYQTDLNGIITIVSPSVYRLSGWKPEELIGQPATLVYAVHGDRSALLQSIAEQGYVRDYELTLIKRDGSRAMASLSAHLLYDTGGSIAGLAGSLRDITERKRAEETFRENERRLSTLTSNLPGMAYRCLNDRDWTMEFVSEGCIALTGYKTVDLVNNQRISFADLIYPQDREDLWNCVQDCVHNKNKYQITYRITTADSKIKWVWEQGQGVFSESGDLLALEGFITDITERKQAEEALRQSEERYRTILEEMEEGYQEVDLAGNYTFVNDSFLRIFGYSRDEMIGTNFRLYTAEEEFVKKVYHAYKRIYKTGIPIKVLNGIL